MNSYTASIPGEIETGLQATIRNGDINMLIEIMRFIDNVVYTAIRYSEYETFSAFLKMLPNTYLEIGNRQIAGEPVAPQMHMQRSSLPAEILWKIVAHELYNTGSDNQNTPVFKDYVRFYTAAFSAYNSLLELSISGIDIESFKSILKKFQDAFYIAIGNYKNQKHQVTGAYQDDGRFSHHGDLNHIIAEEVPLTYVLEKLYSRSLLGIKVWVNFLFFNSQIDLPVFKSLSESIRLPFMTGDRFAEEFLFAIDPEKENYLGRNDWHQPLADKQRLLTETYTSEWFVIGFLIESLLNNSLTVNFDVITGDQKLQLLAVYDLLTDTAKKINEYPEKWQTIFGFQSADTLKQRISQILSPFTLLKRSQYQSFEDELADAKLDPQKIIEFKFNAYTSWKRQTRVRHLFTDQNLIDIVNHDEKKLYRVGGRTLIEKGKAAFIDDNRAVPIYGTEDLAARAGRSEDNLFVTKVFEAAENTLTLTGAEGAIIAGLEKLRSVGITPTHIVTHPEFSYKDDTLLNSTRFESIRNLIFHDQPIPGFIIGHFDKIPVHTVFDEHLLNSFIICDLRKSFRMEIKKSSDWFDQVLDLQIRELKEAEIEQNIVKYKERRSDPKLNFQMSDEEIETILRSSVFFDAFTLVDFIIKDSRAFVIAEII